MKISKFLINPCPVQMKVTITRNQLETTKSNSVLIRGKRREGDCKRNTYAGQRIIPPCDKLTIKKNDGTHLHLILNCNP